MEYVQSPQRSGFWAGLVRLWAFDLQRFRVAIAVVTGLELLRAGLVEWFLHRSTLSLDVLLGGDGYVQFQTLDTVLRVATIVVTALVIEADHPADDRAFWRSRPVSWWQLAAAKLTLLAALFILLPVVVNAVRLIAYGAPAASIVASARQFAVIGGGSIVPAWALALATRTLPRFIGVAMGLTIAWVLAIAIVVAYRPVAVVVARLVGESFVDEAMVAPPVPDWQRLEGRGWTFALLMALGGAACVAGYYRTRRPLLPATAALLLVALPSALPEPAADPAPAGVATGPLGFEGPLRLPARFSHSTRLTSPTTGLTAQLQLPERPANLTTMLFLGPVRVAAGTFAPIARGLPSCCDRGSPAAALAAAWGAAPPDTELSPDPHFYFSVANADAARLRDRIVDVDASAKLQFVRHDLAGEVPLRTGQSFRTALYLVEILGIDTRAKTALCRVALFPTLASPRPHLSFFAGNRRTLVVQALPWWRVDPSLGGRTAIGGARGRTWVALVTLPLGHVADEADARLFIVESRAAGELQTTIVGRGVPVIQQATDAEAAPR